VAKDGSASEFDLAAVGRTVDGPAYTAAAADIVAFAEATNDENPRHLAGEVAPPIYALNPVLKTMVEAKLQVTTQFGFHGEHDIRFHMPIRPGMVLHPSATVIGVQGRSTGVSIVVRIVTRDAGGALVNEQYFVSFVPRRSLSENRGEAAPDHRMPEGLDRQPPASRHDFAMDPDQTRRYARASNDFDAYTLDLDVARSMGFPNVLVHGMCTFAFAGRAVVSACCGSDSTRLRRLAVRLSRPVYLVPGQTISTLLWTGKDGQGARRHWFKSLDRDGETVISNGLAEVA
jgi:acyl dehydratase